MAHIGSKMISQEATSQEIQTIEGYFSKRINNILSPNKGHHQVDKKII